MNRFPLSGHPPAHSALVDARVTSSYIGDLLLVSTSLIPAGRGGGDHPVYLPAQGRDGLVLIFDHPHNDDSAWPKSLGGSVVDHAQIVQLWVRGSDLAVWFAEASDQLFCSAPLDEGWLLRRLGGGAAADPGARTRPWPAGCSR